MDVKVVVSISLKMLKIFDQWKIWFAKCTYLRWMLPNTIVIIISSSSISNKMYYFLYQWLLIHFYVDCIQFCATWMYKEIFCFTQGDETW